MSAIMKAVSPQMCEEIVSGECLLLVCKTLPKLKTPFKCYMYCTEKEFDKTIFDYLGLESVRVVADGQGKVIGEFVCDRVLSLDNQKAIEASKYGNYSIWDADNERWVDWCIDETCVSTDNLIKYLKGKDAHFWHILDLKIYDIPKELSEFRTGKVALDCGYGNCQICDKVLTRPPIGFVYVDEIVV